MRCRAEQFSQSIWIDAVLDSAWCRNMSQNGNHPDDQWIMLLWWDDAVSCHMLRALMQSTTYSWTTNWCPRSDEETESMDSCIKQNCNVFDWEWIDDWQKDWRSCESCFTSNSLCENYGRFTFLLCFYFSSFSAEQCITVTLWIKGTRGKTNNLFFVDEGNNNLYELIETTKQNAASHFTDVKMFNLTSCPHNDKISIHFCPNMFF